MKIRIFSLLVACWMISCGGDKKNMDGHSAKAAKKVEAQPPATKPEKAAINYDIANIKKNSTVDLMQRARDVNMIKMEINNLKRDIRNNLKELED